MEHAAAHGRRPRPAFTLVELLVVIVIVLLVSAVALPMMLPAIAHRQVSEAARLLQAQLVQTRDTAIRFDAPRGMRLLPDPTYANSPTILASNRMIPLEPGPEYSNGKVTIWPIPDVTQTNPSTLVGFPAPSPYPVRTASTPTPVYPYYQQPFVPPTVNPGSGKVLMVEQAMFAANTVTSSGVLAPTSWYWNVRIGDKIKIGNAGHTYTVVGPCTVNPSAPTAALQGNPELFVNVGQPGDTSGYLQRQYTDSAGTPASFPVEHLYLVNAIDDGGVGYTDSGFNGIIDWGLYGQAGMPTAQNDMVADSLFEWQPEKFAGAATQFNNVNHPFYVAAIANSGTATSQNQLLQPSSYTIFRRPVPTQAAREVLLPNNVVIDLTSWNSTSERSRLPVDQFSKYVDIMLQPSGQVQPNTLYSTPASFGMSSSFYHFWLAERQDVHEVSELWGMTGSPPAPAANPNTGLTFHLPMPQDAYNAYVNAGNSFTNTPSVALTGERMLVTLFARTGQVITNSVEFFDVKNVDTPFLDSQLGQREGK